jgi:hypothetical protein
LTNGNIVTGSNTLIVGTRNITRTNGFIDGNLRRTFNAAGARQFDVGTANGYAPVTINAIAGTFPASFVVGAQNGRLVGSDPNQSLTRYWSMIPLGITTANITFQYLQTDLPVGANESGLHFIRRDPTTTTDQGISTLDTNNNIATLNSVTGFSDWSLGIPLAFKTWDGGGVTNNWSEGANWIDDLVPLATDDVVFDSTSTKDVAIDVSVTTDGWLMAPGYTGTISQGTSNVTVNGAFAQSAGAFMSGTGLLSFGGAFMQDGGTFTSPSDLSFVSTITINGGTFNAPSGTLTTIGGVMNIAAAAVFNHNNGTVRFAQLGCCGQTLNLNNTSRQFNNFTIDQSEPNALSFSTGSTVVVNGTLALLKGRMNGGGIVDARGGVTFNTTFAGGDATLLISGNAIRTITFPAGINGLPAMSIDAPNAIFDSSGSGTVSFANALTIQNAASFTNGAVNFVFNTPFTLTSSVNLTHGSGVLVFNSTFVQQSGVFNAGDLDTFGDNFTINGGTFNGAAGGTVTLRGGLTNIAPAAVFNHNNGTFRFTQTSCCGQTLNLNGTSREFNNFTIDQSLTNAMFFLAGDTAVVNGTLALISGRMDGAGIVEARGNVNVINTFSGGSNALSFGGNQNQTYINTGGVNPTGTWTVNKASGSLMLLSDLNIGNGTAPLDLVDGTIVTGPNIVIGGTRSVTRTNGFIRGNLRRSFSAAGPLQFPVGTINGYAPVAINATAGSFPATFTVGGKDGTLAGADLSQSLTRHWSLDPAGITAADITFRYQQTDLPGTANENGLRFIRRSGSLTTDQGISSLDTTNNIATLNNVTGFSDWSLGQPAAECIPLAIGYGQTVTGSLGLGSCVLTGPTDVYAFNGQAGEQIAISMDAAQGGVQPNLELRNAGGTVIVASDSGATNARIPASSGFFTLPTTDTYQIRAGTPDGTAGDYVLTLTLKPAGACNYTVSPSTTNVSPPGGNFLFHVLTGQGCPTVTAATGPNSSHIHIVANIGGQVRFSVDVNAGMANRTGTIIAGGQTHTVVQLGTAAPANDLFAQAQMISGPSGTVTGHNINATAELGEPGHAGSPAANSVWYRWTAPATGLYSFSSVGSNFDTRLAVYTGGPVSNLTEVASNDDTTAFDPTSRMVFSAVSGTEYFLAVDGKNGSTGYINMIWRPAARTYRIYAQTGNGNISPRIPTITATQSGTGTQYFAVPISDGVFELDLPVDNATYTITITGPEVWAPNTFTIDNAGRPAPDAPEAVSDDLVVVARTVSATVSGVLAGLTSANGTTVFLGSEGGPNPIAPEPCAVVVGGTGAVLYSCQFIVDTLHQVKPSLTAKIFSPVNRMYTAPVTQNIIPGPGSMFTAVNGTTYNITGQITGNGSPIGNASVYLTGSKTNSYITAPNGNFEFNNLPAGGSYTITAVAPGFTFLPQTINDLQSNQVLNISAQTACGFKVSTELLNPPAAGGQQTFRVNTTNGCQWRAVNAVPWMTLNLRSGNGTGSVYFTVQPNPGMPRTASITVADQEVTITQPGLPSITGRVT